MSITYAYGAPRSALVYAASDGKHRPASHPLLGGIRQPQERTADRIAPFSALLLVQRRLEKGWTQQRLGAEIGVGPKSVSAWEHGLSPSPARLAMLEELLGSLRA